HPLVARTAQEASNCLPAIPKRVIMVDRERLRAAISALTDRAPTALVRLDTLVLRECDSVCASEVRIPFSGVLAFPADPRGRFDPSAASLTFAHSSVLACSIRNADPAGENSAGSHPAFRSAALAKSPENTSSRKRPRNPPGS